MKPWILQGGEKVWLGGRVEGESPLATSLRDDIALSKEEELSSGFGAFPATASLDANVPYLLDSWLRSTVGVVVVESPEVEYPADDPDAVTDPDVIY
ncbi:MAG TPA: hypothetical protein VFH17_07660 [Coriobacteriia bacterium]|nr:hypothetical protein [Coriobacteriia bacterium]